MVALGRGNCAQQAPWIIFFQLQLPERSCPTAKPHLIRPNTSSGIRSRCAAERFARTESRNGRLWTSKSHMVGCRVRGQGFA